MCDAAISQSRSVSVGSCLIRQLLAVCDGAGRFCRGEKTSGSASVEPFGEEKERDAMHPDKRARRVSIVAGNQLESGRAVTTIRQPLSQIAKTEGTTSEVAANLTMKEHHGQGEGQNTNHGEDDQC